MLALFEERYTLSRWYFYLFTLFSGYCSIQWSQSGGSYSFTVTNDTYVNVGDGTIGTINSEIFGPNCTTDFVVIPAPILTNNATTLTFDRFCGNGFTGITSKNMFILVFNS